ncbi:NMDA receptor synaptonuclear signaling and neuronal migration factor-like [Diadema antillarum]|uniref:NMDA receptor synaptonuclear signaling and neuronal migration factor-like n=1 Tax=Diadema antillarum TaxID=105358 RepID=UPI003A8AB6D2
MDANGNAAQPVFITEGNSNDTGVTSEKRNEELAVLTNGTGEQNGVLPEEHSEERDEIADRVTKIQSVFRGFQDRKLLQKQNDMAIKIQRQFRRHRSSISTEDDISRTVTPAPTKLPPITPSVPDFDHKPVKKLTKEEQMKLLAERKEQRRTRARAWRDKAGLEADKKEFKIEIGTKTKQEFGVFQSEITELQWYAEQQLEVTECGGPDYQPPRILLISSNVPKADMLQATAHEKGVLVFNYDFNNDTFDTLLDAIRVNLQAYRQGCKARSLCIYASGGPGYLYILKKKVLTTAKLKKESEADQVRFWKEVGKMMSRINPEDTVIHIMGCNILGSESGLQMFDYLEDIMRPNIVRFESPLELTGEGAEMISSYFSPVKYRLWKSTKYSKSEMKLPPSMR